MSVIHSSALLLTPPGAAAIAVLRLTGPLVRPFLERHFSRTVPVGRCVHGVIKDTVGQVIDDPVVTMDDRGNADLNLHGGPWVVRSVSALAAQHGFQIVDPADGLPSNDAVDAHTALEADVLRHLPLARTDLAVEMLLNQADAWQELRSRLTGMAQAACVAELTAILKDATLVWLLRPPRVAIIGLPNVGKSTLANALFARETSITADLPGTTRDWVGEIANIDGLAVMLLDTPGLRLTDDTIEASAIERAADEIQLADLRVIVIDASCAMAGAQAELLDRFPDAIRVLNKSDRAVDQCATDGRSIATVATTGQGVDTVRQAIRSKLGIDRRPVMAPRWWTACQRQQLNAIATSREGLVAWIDAQFMRLDH